ncbi:CO dehydrogenase nickel-insertion accessory protein CooC1 [Amycolatopsis marina]|uniref:CO dehydrogenase nickel-insertion accessory protein CooC1 n=1 Tax=Amycolatopsis marina TaxID=490629 RepID=A0A1I1C2S9_9PSEU|nr:AAA family ATPase [Amycolatopsis marina]SFB56975.1 CO dehydrogenase nickel-insertion accessory protein CooC1 [Amycolatopsis marina]
MCVELLEGAEAPRLDCDASRHETVRDGVIAIRLALIGKGGAGKSALAGTLARILARRGERVLAVDCDPMPGLSLSLGLGVVDVRIPDDATEERPEGEDGPRYRLRRGLSAERAVEMYAVPGPDGVRYLQFGKLRERTPQLMRAQFAFRQILDELSSSERTVVGDLAGGTRQPFFGWGRYAELLIVVVEPTAKGVLSARRLARLASLTAGQERPGGQRVAAVVTKAGAPDDAALVTERTGLEVLAAVPWDRAVCDAERYGISVLDHAPGSPAVAAITALADRLAEHRPALASLS